MNAPQSRRLEPLAEAILRDREAHATRQREQRDRPQGLDFDPYLVSWRMVAGGDPGFLPTIPMRKGPVGFFISCRGCGTKFESKGLAYCLVCMDLPAEERHAMTPAIQGRMCQAPGCENFIDRKKRANVRFCSEACSKRARRAAG